MDQGVYIQKLIIDKSSKNELNTIRIIISMNGCISTIANPTGINLHSTTVLDLFMAKVQVDQ